MRSATARSYSCRPCLRQSPPRDSGRGSPTRSGRLRAEPALRSRGRTAPRSWSTSCSCTRRDRSPPCSGATTATRVGGVRRPRRAAAAARPRHGGAYEYGSRAGVWRLARIFDEAGVPVTVSAAAVALELNPAVPAWMREREHDLMGHGWRWIQLWGLRATRSASTYAARSRATSARSGSGRSDGTARRGRASRRESCSSRRAAFSTTRTRAPTTSRTTSAPAACPFSSCRTRRRTTTAATS